jgi:hypothetical protein
MLAGSDREDAMPDLYDEVVLFTKATKMFRATYEKLDNAEMYGAGSRSKPLPTRG